MEDGADGHDDWAAEVGEYGPEAVDGVELGNKRVFGFVRFVGWLVLLLLDQGPNPVGAVQGGGWVQNSSTALVVVQRDWLRVLMLGLLYHF